MSTDRTNDTDTDSSDGFDDGDTRVPGAGDDERESRTQIGETGEPERDALGNADGAS